MMFTNCRFDSILRSISLNKKTVLLFWVFYLDIKRSTIVMYITYADRYN